MRKITSLPLAVLVLLSACSTHHQNHTTQTNHHYGRYIASGTVDIAGLRKNSERLMDGIFHSYLMGQTYLEDFDKKLDEDPTSAMKSDAYYSLLAVRNQVDQFEHDLNDFYVGMVLATALPQFSPAEKASAEVTLDVIGKFLDGIRSNQEELPENFRPLILSNLREKQTEVYRELKNIRDDFKKTNNDPSIIEAIERQMVLVRATRMAYHKDLKSYKVKKSLLRETIKQEEKKQNYKQLKEEIEQTSTEIKQYMAEIGRATSSDVIFPSADKSGNISGKTFPQNTWSLTYDDGPAATTPTVLKNLQARNIPATFFVLAKQVVAYPETAKSIKDAGMEIASHSYTHAQLTKVGPEQLEKEIGTSKKVIQEKLGVNVDLFRLPYGAGVSVSHVRSKIAEHKMVHVFWTVDTLDWQDKNPTTIMARTLKQINAAPRNSGVVLFHDIHPQSVTASTMLMDYFNEKKLTVCTVGGVVNQINKGLESCK